MTLWSPTMLQEIGSGRPAPIRYALYSMFRNLAFRSFGLGHGFLGLQAVEGPESASGFTFRF